MKATTSNFFIRFSNNKIHISFVLYFGDAAVDVGSGDGVVVEECHHISSKGNGGIVNGEMLFGKINFLCFIWCDCCWLLLVVCSLLIIAEYHFGKQGLGLSWTSQTGKTTEPSKVEQPNF